MSLSCERVADFSPGLTGVSAAAHVVGHGFDVTIFEADGEEHVGGIWSVCRLRIADLFKS